MSSSLPMKASSTAQCPVDREEGEEEAEARRVKQLDKRARARERHAQGQAYLNQVVSNAKAMDPKDNALNEGVSLKLRASKAAGRFVTASLPTNQDVIPVGTCLLKEGATAHCLLKQFQDEYCARCFGRLKAPTFSDNSGAGLFGTARPNASHPKLTCLHCCRQIFWCSKECQALDMPKHRLECAILKELPGISGMHSVDYSILRLALHALSQAAVESQTKDDTASSSAGKSSIMTDNTLPTPLSFALDMCGHVRSHSEAWIACVTAASEDFCSLLAASPEFASAIPSGSRSLLLNPSALVRFAAQINANSHAIQDPSLASNRIIGVGLYPMISLLNHSCAPNCIFVSSTHGQMSLFALRDIAAGEEISYSYIDLFLPKVERRGQLLTSKNFYCACVRCHSPEELHVPMCPDGPSIDPDHFIDALLCENACAGGSAFYLPPPGVEDLLAMQDDSSPHTCPFCAHELTHAQFLARQHAVERAFQAAMALQVSPASGREALRAFRAAHCTLIHPAHHLWVATCLPLISSAVAVAKVDEAVEVSEELCGLMERAPFIPTAWPEVADLHYQRGELWEMVAVTKQAQESGDMMVGLEDALTRAHEAFRISFDKRCLAYGSSHPRTQEAQRRLVESTQIRTEKMAHE